MDGFIFSDNFPAFAYCKDSFIANFENINGGEELFNQLKTMLKFPDYFGGNWNALNDCLGDFNWVSQKNII